jgi:DHA1 family bicyclomycin/chloramphenicol resistance-like MFS transporter
MYEKEDFARTMSFITLVVMVAPLFAPMLGGYLAGWFGWRSLCWVLAVVSGLVIAAVIWKIPETLAPENRQKLHFRTTIQNYIRLFMNPVALGLMFAGAFSFAGMFAFLTAGSFVYIDVYGVGTSQFGYLFGLNIVGLFVMTTVNGRIVRRVSSKWMLSFAILIQLVAGVGLFFGWLADIGLWGIVPFVMLYISMMSTVGSNSMAILLSAYPGMAGTASSLAGTLRFGIGSIIGVIVAMLPSDTAWPMILIMTLCAVMSAVFYWFLGRKA